MDAQHSEGLAMQSEAKAQLWYAMTCEGKAWIDTLSEGIAPLRKGVALQRPDKRRHGEDRPGKGKA